MISFISCQATDMERLFWFSLLLIDLPITESCLSQPSEVIWQKTGQNVILPCIASPDCSSKSWRYKWLSLKTNSHPQRLPDNSVKYKLNGSSLHIENLQANDSGIYYCAAVLEGNPQHGGQYVGMGTPLVVIERVNIMVSHILLWLLFVLLAVYSLALVTLIMKKHGCIRLHNTDRVSKHSNASKKKIFRDVLQEMYRKRNMERSKQTASRNRSHVETANTDFSSSTDDVYQNV